MMKDLHIFVEAGSGFLQFDHDRTLEYFLALGLASSVEPSLETLDDLIQYLRRFKTQGKPVAAARLYFQLAPKERFSIISTALRLLDSRDSRYGSSDRELLFGFAREVLVEMAEQGEPLAERYLEDAIYAAQSGKIGEHQMRTVVQATASLPIERAIPLLSRVVHSSSVLAITEANIYATDKLVKQYLLHGCPSIDLLREYPYAVFFGDTSITAWQRLGRLLSFAAQLGPDNTHSHEYASILQVLNVAFENCLSEGTWSEDAAAKFAAFFLKNCDRLLFNATESGINQFFDNQRRSELEAIMDKLADGGVLSKDDLAAFESYTETSIFESDIEYHLSHIFFILSSFNDLEATLQLAEARFATFSNNTSPIKIDFFNAVLVYLHVLHNLPYDEARFGSWEEKVLRDWPDVLLHRPGLERGERRGFQDLFDRVFEDGFGVLYPYGLLLPSIRRRRSYYADYRRELAAEFSTQLPLYTKYLEEFLDTDRVEEALQIMQALGGVIVAWPTEGLLTLSDIIGYPEPRVRRATIRILAEAFNRHPDETLQFLKTSGAAVSDEELIEIKLRQDARIGRRQVDEREWARIGHFLSHRHDFRNKFVACVRVLLRAPSFQEAVTNILQTLELVSVAGR
jgi:hypothetical protein